MRVLVTLTMLAIAYPFVALALLPDRPASVRFVLSTTIVLYMVGLPSLIAATAWITWRGVQRDRATVEDVARALGLRPSGDAAGPPNRRFAGSYRGRPVEVQTEARLDPHRNDAGRRRFGAHTVAVMTLSARDGAARSAVVRARGLTVDQVRQHLDSWTADVPASSSRLDPAPLLDASSRLDPAAPEDEP